MFTRRRIRVTILWLPLLFLMTDAADARAQANGAIAGIVHDGLSGEPLGNVQVLVRPEGDSTVVAAGGLTASSGRFSITGLRPGRYRIAFHLLGYAGTARTITMPAAGAAGALDVGDLQMTTAAITLD